MVLLQRSVKDFSFLMKIFSIFLLQLNFFTTGDEIMTYEYGTHVPGEQIAFTYENTIPPYEPVYNLNVSHEQQDLAENYTYLRIEYYNPTSKVTLKYDPAEQIATFIIKLPFSGTDFVIIGFAMPKSFQPATPKTNYSTEEPDSIKILRLKGQLDYKVKWNLD